MPISEITNGGNDIHTNFKLTQTKGNEYIILSDPNFMNGLNVCAGNICEPAVAETHNLDYMNPAEALEFCLN